MMTKVHQIHLYKMLYLDEGDQLDVKLNIYFHQIAINSNSYLPNLQHRLPKTSHWTELEG